MVVMMTHEGNTSGNDGGSNKNGGGMNGFDKHNNNDDEKSNGNDMIVIHEQQQQQLAPNTTSINNNNGKTMDNRSQQQEQQQQGSVSGAESMTEANNTNNIAASSTTTTTTTMMMMNGASNSNPPAKKTTRLQQAPPPPPEAAPGKKPLTTLSSSSLAAAASGVGRSMVDLAKWVPMRLTSEERSLLTVLEQCLHVSEYTDHVDVAFGGLGVASSRRGGYYSSSFSSSSSSSNHNISVKTRRILDGILEACHISTGLAMTGGLQSSRQLPTTTMTSGGGSGDSNGGGNGLNGLLGSVAGRKKKNKVGGGIKSKLSSKKNKKKQKNGRNINNASSSHAGDTPQADGAIGGGSGGTYWASRDPVDNEELFQTMFEIGRRNKVLNPASMRTTYGKLMYLLQDAQNPSVAKSLGFTLHKDILLVGPFLRDHGCADLLHDARLECAVQYVSDRDEVTGERYDREHVSAMVQGKRRVTDELVSQYAGRSSSENGGGGGPTEDDVRRAIESLADAVAYIESNVRPVQRMLRYLEENFRPDKAEKDFSLALRGGGRISSGGYGSSSPYYTSSNYSRYGLSAYGGGGSSSEGPKLSHSHTEQYTFVWQSLRLWSKVMRHMHRLWICADDDLLSTTSSYHLYNTGQGLNRVQNCPRVRKVMSNLLSQTQQEAGKPWVGLSVIHLGDRDVPNALVFIDKYTQIPRFLNPICHFLQDLTTMCHEDDRIRNYINDEFDTVERLRKLVLCDYFKHGFDGSGDDGGSCIDGRLTSSWNWTSRISKKPYYHALMLTGFQGFDGEFR